ncbi:MAG TPA: VWA domain-containing protein, partial [Terriglobales bacterium]|nr:VWA domain-containing protein [Terriglobales bacterium]
MKRRIAALLDALRQAEIRISTAEAIDALEAVAVAGIERDILRAALATSVIKDEADRPTFDRLFDSFFPLAVAKGGKAARQKNRDEPGNGSGSGTAEDVAPAPRPTQRREEEPSQQRGEDAPQDGTARAGEKLARRRSALAKPFRAMTPDDVDECALLAESLAQRLWAHRRRRMQPSKRHLLDMRRTLRRATSSGGVPLAAMFRRHRRGRIDLVALCDVSYSCTAASAFL